MKQSRQASPALRAAAYALSMLAAVVSGSGFVIGGMVGAASGWSAVLLAGAVPAAALIWAWTLSLFESRNTTVLPLAGYGHPVPPHPHSVVGRGSDGGGGTQRLLTDQGRQHQQNGHHRHPPPDDVDHRIGHRVDNGPAQVLG